MQGEETECWKPAHVSFQGVWIRDSKLRGVSAWSEQLWNSSTIIHHIHLSSSPSELCEWGFNCFVRLMDFQQVGHILLNKCRCMPLYFCKDQGHCWELVGEVFSQFCLWLIRYVQSIYFLFAKLSDKMMFPALCSTLSAFWASLVVCV